MWLKRPKDDVSVTLTLLTTGFIIATTKLLVSGVEIGNIRFGEFNGTEYSIALTALAGLYWARKRDSKKKENDENPPSSSSSSSSSSINQTK